MPNVFNNPEAKQIIQDTVESIKIVLSEADDKLYSNVLDPFSAIFDANVTERDFEKWIVSEKSRQNQKSLQNKIGEFHQKILGSVGDWEDLGDGGRADIFSKKHKIIAEIKNKHNTTNSTSSLGSYDALASLIDNREQYKGFTAYFVQIIRKNRQQYNDCFTPRDSKNKTNRPKREDIRIIDGKSFYQLITGEETGLKQCYGFTVEQLKSLNQHPQNAEQFVELFKRAFGD
jgi:hypothetical protein